MSAVSTMSTVSTMSIWHIPILVHVWKTPMWHLSIDLSIDQMIFDNTCPEVDNKCHTKKANTKMLL